VHRHLEWEPSGHVLCSAGLFTSGDPLFLGPKECHLRRKDDPTSFFSEHRANTVQQLRVCSGA